MCSSRCCPSRGLQTNAAQHVGVTQIPKRGTSEQCHPGEMEELGRREGCLEEETPPPEAEELLHRFFLPRPEKLPGLAIV